MRATRGPLHEVDLLMPFNIGPMELIVVLIIALIVVGPGKLPDVGSALGKSIREFRKAATDVKETTSLEPAKSAEQPAVAATAAPAIANPEPATAPVPAPIPPALAAAPVGVAIEAPVEAAAAAEESADAAWPADLTPVADELAAVADEAAAPVADEAAKPTA